MKKKKRPHWKRPRLSNEEVLQLFKDGVYKADLENGIVLKRNGEPLAIMYGGRDKQWGKDEKRQFVSLYWKQRIRNLPVSHVIWMVGNDDPFIPPSWEVHHRDLDATYNWFDNLYCLHPKDHQKLHGRDLIEEEEETPF